MAEEIYHLGGLISFATLYHIIFPFILGFILKKRWLYGILLLVLFELFENLSGITLVIKGFFIIYPEPFVNIVSDLVIGTIFLYLGFLVDKKKIFKYKKK